MFLGSDDVAHILDPKLEAAHIVYTGVSTDTRTIEPGNLFVALKNEKADGHDFISAAIAKGAAGIVCEREPAEYRCPAYIVDDTTIAYGKLARAWRDRFNIPVVGVTGSVGKTSTKEMLALTLSPLGNILKTEASQNNETGVPKTLLQLNPEHKAAIIEMGMRGRGQIEYLCQIAAPTAGVVTLIAENHIELLGSIEEIAESKGELLEFLSLDGVAFINADDIYCAKLASKHRGRVVTFAVDSPAEYKADNLVFRNNSWTFEINGQMLTIATPSRHDVSNAVTAYAVAYTFGVDPESAASALARYEPPPMRMQIIDGASWGGTILNDAYNAAPASMRAALETLSRYGGGRKIAFLGDMRELGDYAAPAHEELGAVIQDLGGLDALYTVGDLAAHIFGASRRFKTSEDAALFARDELMLDKGDIILVKGSRVMEMERIASALRNKERHDEF